MDFKLTESGLFPKLNEDSGGSILMTASDAKIVLEAEGLHISQASPHGLWIAGTLERTGDGVHFSQDACALNWDGGRWRAVFPAEGMLKSLAH